MTVGQKFYRFMVEKYYDGRWIHKEYPNYCKLDLASDLVYTRHTLKYQFHFDRKETYLRRLEKMHACDDCIKIFKECWEEFEKEAA